MDKKDYSKLSEVIVTSQAEMDEIPSDYTGRIIIKSSSVVRVEKRYYLNVWARDNSSVEAYNNSSVEAWGNSSVEAWENSSVVARGNSSVVARGNVQVLQRSNASSIQLSGNARIVTMPKNIYEYFDFYGVERNEKFVKLYKAVHKRDGKYISDYRSTYEYEIGKEYVEKCDSNKNETCGRGLHVAHLAWALNFGRNWKDLAILEVEVDINDIVYPKNTDGKVRTSKLKVLREVPLEECGLLGKILAKKRG